jgi:hypothetical protein
MVVVAGQLMTNVPKSVGCSMAGQPVRTLTAQVGHSQALAEIKILRQQAHKLLWAVAHGQKPVKQ